jgi:hypothetical protein
MRLVTLIRQRQFPKLDGFRRRTTNGYLSNCVLIYSAVHRGTNVKDRAQEFSPDRSDPDDSRNVYVRYGSPL